MLRSLNSGIAGLKASQTKLDVIGNNIANVNTTGFKKGRVLFEDIFSQTVKAATPASETTGGVNPNQIGIGVKVATVENLFTPGSPTVTNNPSDLYIDGDGFFTVEQGGKTFLTRAGNFTIDSMNRLVNSNGLMLLDTNLEQVVLPPGSVSYSIDSTGVITGVNQAGERLIGVYTNQAGDLISVTSRDYELAIEEAGPGVTSEEAIASEFPGYKQIKIGISNVTNPSGLSKAGGSLYAVSNSSGDFGIINDNNNNNVRLLTGHLEMSNVDLSEEMTDMIIAQRSFQANTKIITTSDAILDELINLKR
ncbi:flagellar hook-basal body complex protein [Bacillus sp. B15-48]|uniref:flagellar hook-basal body complex protein n=1 Tax=Bacillus sp. B15-48 TaxID=1548601 RepID=UPI00193EF206|nr:flagellar hook-basal body complex protein [Bacillus sp. B15-48]MBM4764129.1 flagellar hook-basal body complex protein [Bacillus sp. B15-48]